MSSLIKAVRLTPALAPIITLKTEDGQYRLGIKSLCISLGVSHTGQIQRIRHTPELAAALVYETIETLGGNQKIAMLEVWGVSLWAATLHITRLAPTARETALLLKQDAYNAVKRAFEDEKNEATLKDAKPLGTTAPSAPTKPTLLDTFTAILQGFEELKEHVVGIDQRLLIVEQDRLGRRVESGARLSAAQVGQLFMQLSLLRDQTGLPVEEAEKRLAAQFGVAHIIDIDASEWATLNYAIMALFQR